MSFLNEDQHLESQALTAIFSPLFTITSPTHWSLQLLSSSSLTLSVSLPPTYPHETPPEFTISGCPHEKQLWLEQRIRKESWKYVGRSCIYDMSQWLMEWMECMDSEGYNEGEETSCVHRRDDKDKKDNNEDDKDNMFQKLRGTGTPVTRETFDAWKKRFEQESREKQEEETRELEQEKSARKKASSKLTLEEFYKGRLTGYEQFMDKNNSRKLELLDEFIKNEQEIGDIMVNEELYEMEDDLEELVFESEEEDYQYQNEVEI